MDFPPREGMIPARSDCLDNTVIHYKGSGGCWTGARPARQGGGVRMQGKGSDNCGWIWLWWGGMGRGKAPSSREAGVWGGDKNTAAGTTYTQAHTHTCKQINVLQQISLTETVHSTSTLNLHGIPSNNWTCTGAVINSFCFLASEEDRQTIYTIMV